jgi:hypothetical protein
VVRVARPGGGHLQPAGRQRRFRQRGGDGDLLHAGRIRVARAGDRRCGHHAAGHQGGGDGGAAIEAPPAPTAARLAGALRIRTGNLALAACALAGIVGILKGVTPTLDANAEFYWRFSYAHGFIKRGLLGTAFQPFLWLFSFDQLKPAIVAAHLAVCFAIIVFFHRLFASIIHREPRADSRGVLVLAFLCLMSTELLPVLAHDTGNADAWLIALTLAGFWLALHARHRAAAAVAVLGPLVHEAFVFLWAPIGILLLWSVVSAPTANQSHGRAWKIVLAVLPAAVALLVSRAHDAAAVTQLMNAWQVSDAIKTGHQVYTFGQTLQSSFAHMREFEFRGHWDNFATAAVFFLTPNLLLIWAAGYCFWYRWSSPRATLIVAVAAMLAPLAVVIIGWDLSRFFCWSTVAAGIAVVGVGSERFVSMGDAGA